mmetsp:Transcript_7650/g.10558  ORF Transcript_7650/g.10558 Transcript_7650/m.10558 type:complete len:1025 (+) Transcript_7650:187-3261(+)
MRFFFIDWILLTSISSKAALGVDVKRLRQSNRPSNAQGSPTTLFSSSLDPSENDETSGRVLAMDMDMHMDHNMFQPLSCNDELSVDDCVIGSSNYLGTLSTVLGTTPTGEQVVIPCGKCAVVETTDGSTKSLPDGINVEGMLHFPSTANLTLETTHIVIQGILQMDPPDAALRNKVRVRMVGSEDHILYPHTENESVCDGMVCNVGKKAIVVAGGRLDIQGLEDDTCPAWAKLQSTVPPSGTAASTDCPLDHDITQGDGSFASVDIGSTPSGFGQHHSSGTFEVDKDEDGNKYLTQVVGWKGSGLRVSLDMTCADPASASNNGGKYRFSFRYRTHEGGSNGVAIWLQLQRTDGGRRNVGRCPAPIDNEWVTCTTIITLTDVETELLSQVATTMETKSGKTIDYDDVVFEAVARSHKLTVADPKAAACWGSRPNDEILITNIESSGGWADQAVKTVQSVDDFTGEIDVGQTKTVGGNPTSLEDDIHMASEVAWLSRPIVFEAEGDGPSNTIKDALHGGHLIIYHTPNVAQRIEGVEIHNFGQQGELGRYPIHFHMSGNVAGSTVRKNVIRESNQRCVVIHGSHEVLVEDNVAFDSYGHCYILEDGGEEDNTFKNNLGARTRTQPKEHSIGSSDHKPSTLWITNPKNHFIGNVCAGSQSTGIWFELRAIRGDSAELSENEGKDPKVLPLHTFKDNTAHSNHNHGMTTYFLGYRPHSEALFEGITSYQNRNGLMLHGTSNVRVKDAFFGMNTGSGVLYFGNFITNIIENSEFVGYCGTSGIKFSLEPRRSQVEVYSTSFSGYNDACNSGSYGKPLNIGNVQSKKEYDMPILSNLTFDSNIAHALNIGTNLENRNIFIEDHDGTMNPSGLPGFYVNDAAHMTTFIDTDLCSPGLNNQALFCENTCLRRIIVDTGSRDDYQMVVASETNSAKVFTFDKYITFNSANTQFDVVLPLDNYNVHFLRLPEQEIMVPPAVTFTFDDETNLDDPPNCEHITTASISFGCMQAHEECSASNECCSGDCSGEGKCM